MHLIERVYHHLKTDDASRTVHHMVLMRANGNCLFNTKAGMLGMATRQLEKEDEVFLIAGLGLPMIFRRNAAGCYRVIGPAYIPGMMQGEMWSVKNEGLTALNVV